MMKRIGKIRRYRVMTRRRIRGGFFVRRGEKRGECSPYCRAFSRELAENPQAYGAGSRGRSPGGVAICKCLAAGLVLALLCGALAGCGSGESGGERRLSVVATVFPLYDFAREVAGKRADVRLLLPAGHASHGYEPTLRDLRDIRESDVFLYVGDDADDWVDGTDPDLLVNTRKTRLADDFPGAEHPWTSPRNAMMMVRRVMDALCAADPRGTETYRQNFLKYQDKLRRLDEGYRAAAEGGATKTLVFAGSFPFSAMAEEYGLTAVASLSRCSEDEEVDLGTVARLSGAVRENNLPLVLVSEFSDARAAGVIAKTAGCAVAVMHSCHNLSAEERAAGETYLSLMSRNLEILGKALGYAA